MVHPIIVVVNDDSSVSYAVANVLDARCRDHNILHVDQLQNDYKGETDRNALHKVLYFSLVMRKAR